MASTFKCSRHEIVGVVTATGSNVEGFKVGDHVGVGTYVNSCRNCEYCDDFLEVFCSKGATLTFNGLDSDGTVTKGGYSSFIVVHERQVFRELSISIIMYQILDIQLSCTKFLSQTLHFSFNDRLIVIPDQIELAYEGNLVIKHLYIRFDR